MLHKLTLHTAACIGLIVVLVFHYRAGARRWAVAALLASVLCVGAAPLIYRLWPGGPVARVTINWPQLAMLTCLVVFFTPAKGRKFQDLGSNTFDTAIPTDAAPLGKD